MAFERAAMAAITTPTAQTNSTTASDQHGRPNPTGADQLGLGERSPRRLQDDLGGIDLGRLELELDRLEPRWQAWQLLVSHGYRSRGRGTNRRDPARAAEIEGTTPASSYEIANLIDRIGLGRRLVGPVTANSGEPQRHPSGVSSRQLNTVDGDLDHLLGTYEHHMTVTAGPLADLELEQSLRLPAQQSRRSAP